MKANDFGFDSGEYELLTEAVELSKGTEGLYVEIGVRLGRGTATIMEAVKQYCPNKHVVSIDPYGSIPYIGREHVGEIRLDYDNPMKHTALSQLNLFALELGVMYDHYPLTDYLFFKYMSDGVPYYNDNEYWDKKYAMVHLDAQHTVADVCRQIKWFNERMDSGASIVIDDITIDFMDIIPINQLLVSLGWEILKQGLKKGLYKKI